MGAIFFVFVQSAFKVRCTTKQTVLSALDLEIVKIRFLIEIYRREIAKPLILEVSINIDLDTTVRVRMRIGPHY